MSIAGQVLGFLLRGKLSMIGELANRFPFWRQEDGSSTGYIEVTGDGYQVNEKTVSVNAIDGLLNRHSPLYGSGLCLSEKPGRFPYLLRWYPGDFLYLIERIFLNPLYKLIPAMSIVFNEFLVIKPFANYYVGHTQR